MKLSDVKNRDRIIGIVAGAVIFQTAGLDPYLRRMGGVVFSFCILVLLFFLIPIIIEYLERKFVK